MTHSRHTTHSDKLADLRIENVGPFERHSREIALVGGRQGCRDRGEMETRSPRTAEGPPKSQGAYRTNGEFLVTRLCFHCRIVLVAYQIDHILAELFAHARVRERYGGVEVPNSFLDVHHNI